MRVIGSVAHLRKTNGFPWSHPQVTSITECEYLEHLGSLLAVLTISLIRHCGPQSSPVRGDALAQEAAAQKVRKIHSSPEPPEPKYSAGAVSHIPALDGLRGSAILIVMFIHFYLFQGTKAYLDSTFLKQFWGLAAFGWCGVDLFFVISGFLITSILLNTKESPSYLKSFYSRRAVRIFPLYFLCLLLYYHVPLSVFRIDPGLPHSPHEIWFWTYLANWKIGLWKNDELSLFWSLCVEEQFYFIWPLVVWITGKRTFPWLCLGLIGASLCAGIGFELAGLPMNFVFMASFPRAEAIVMGSLLAWLVRQSWRHRVTEHLKLLLPASFGLMLVCALNPPYFQGFYTLQFLIVGVGWSALVLDCCTHSDGLAARVMRSRFLGSFGKYSYAIYVLHEWVIFHVGNFAFRIFRPYISFNPALLAAVFASSFASSYLAGVLSWHFFEKHFLRLKKYFPYQVGLPVSSEREAGALTKAAVAG